MRRALAAAAPRSPPGSPAAAPSRTPRPRRACRTRGVPRRLGLVAARAELERLRQGAEGNEPFDFFAGRVAFERGPLRRRGLGARAAGVEDKPGSYLRLAKDTRAITDEHEQAESEHFVFLYPKGKDEVLAPYALEALEAAARGPGEGPRPRPAGEGPGRGGERRRRAGQVSTLTQRADSTTGTIAICKFNKLMVTSPKAVLRGYDWLDTLAHEYVHLVVSQTGHNTVPIWLHGGAGQVPRVALARAGGQGADAVVAARCSAERVQKNTLIPFEKMHPSMAQLPTGGGRGHGVRRGLLRRRVSPQGARDEVAPHHRGDDGLPGPPTSRRWRRPPASRSRPSRRAGWPI